MNLKLGSTTSNNSSQGFGRPDVNSVASSGLTSFTDITENFACICFEAFSILFKTPT